MEYSKRKRILTISALITIILGLLTTTKAASHDINIEPIQTPTDEVYMKQVSVVPYEPEPPTQANTEPKKVHAVQVEGGYDSILSKYDWNVDDARTIMMCESGGDPTIDNWKDVHKGCIGSHGLFQLACFRGTIDELYNPEINIQRAYELYLSLGRRFGTTRGWYNCSQKHNIY